MSSDKTYFNNDDVRKFCFLLDVDTQTVDKIVKAASSEAGYQHHKGSAYLYKDEQKLFEVMKSYLNKKFQVHKINSFGELVNWCVWHERDEDE